MRTFISKNTCTSIRWLSHTIFKQASLQSQHKNANGQTCRNSELIRLHLFRTAKNQFQNRIPSWTSFQPKQKSLAVWTTFIHHVLVICNMNSKAIEQPSWYKCSKLCKLAHLSKVFFFFLFSPMVCYEYLHVGYMYNWECHWFLYVLFQFKVSYTMQFIRKHWS